MDIVYSLVELADVSCDNVNTKTLSEYANDLIISMLDIISSSHSLSRTYNYVYLSFSLVLSLSLFSLILSHSLVDLLPDCSAFSDHPSVLDMDIFSLVVSY